MTLIAAVLAVLFPVGAVGVAHQKGCLNLDNFPPKIVSENCVIEAPEYNTGN